MIIPTAKENIIQLDIAYWAANDSDKAFLDISKYLYQGLMLRESEFRQSMTELDWKSYSHKLVAVYLSTAAIVPTWAYMLVAQYLTSVDASAHFGLEGYDDALLIHKFERQDLSILTDKRVLLKGCSQTNITPKAYMHITARLSRIVRSLAFGESCSSVPIFKK